jgi:hypothetical protein
MDRYLPVADHGLVGDLHTAALVGVEGTIDWYCCPDFDSPSVFGAILDRARGGYWRIAPRGADWTSGAPCRSDRTSPLRPHHCENSAPMFACTPTQAASLHLAERRPVGPYS